MEKIVKGATKIKLAAPKSKYIEPILSATQGGESGVAEIFRTLQLRLRDSTWTIVFKSLIVVHLMIREGAQDITLRYVAESPKRLAISSFTEVQTQGVNIRRYSEYLLERVKGYRDGKVDFVRAGAGRMRKLTIEKGLLRQTEVVQEQIRALVRCDLLGNHDPDNEITLTAFRLLTMDLLELFKVMNEGTINVLEHYFEMSRPDAERALNIYKTFGKQTDMVVQYLSLARQYEMATRLEVPKLKHAPTTLTASLEEYLNDPDFDINRRQYLAQQESKRTGKPVAAITAPKTSATTSERPVKADSSFPSAPSRPNPAPAKGPAPDLIDFFESIEQNQQAMAQQPTYPPQQQFQQGFVQAQPQYAQLQNAPQQTGYNPFLQSPVAQQPQQPQQQMQPNFTGAGFGGYTAQPQQQPQQPQQYQQQLVPFQFPQPLQTIPQNGVPEFPTSSPIQSPAQQLQPQTTSTNPFRHTAMPTGPTASPVASPTGRQGTNPFARQPTGASQQGFAQTSTPAFSPQQPQSQHPDLQNASAFFNAQSPPQQGSGAFPPAAPLQPERTGTNPFAKNRSPPPPAAPLVANVTGSTNPFRQSAFVNQQTGQGWQHGNQGTFSGFDINNVDTMPVFPRPGAA